MNKKRVFSWLLTSLAVFFIISCNDVTIGLGGAVDVSAPILFVDETPKAGDIVRGPFRLSGNGSDDTGIVSLVVTFKNISTKETIEFDASKNLTKEGYWNLDVDPHTEDKNYYLKDGQYEVSFVASDYTKKSTTISRQFTIDNTPPVVILTRPSTKEGDKSKDSYGQILTLEGKSHDESDVSLIVVEIYDEAENLLKTISLENVPKTIELDFAEYTGDANGDYETIFGTAEKLNQTRDRFCKIFAYDSAVSYPIPQKDELQQKDTIGNCSDFYYLNDEISADVLKNYKITDLYAIFAGTFNESNRTAVLSVEETLEILKKREITKGSFSMNPENSPVLAVTGMDSLKADGLDFDAENNSDYRVVQNGENKTIEVSPGLDATPIEYTDESSLRVYFLECDEMGSPLPNAPKIYPTNVISTDKKGSSYRVTVNITKKNNVDKDGNQINLAYKHNYLFKIEGKDQNGNSIIDSDKGYGFRFESNGVPPALTVTEPADSMLYLKKADSITFKGVITIEDGSPSVSVVMDDQVLWIMDYNEADGTPADGSLVFNFEKTIDKDYFNQSVSKEYPIQIVAENGAKTTVSKTIQYDVDAPEISISSSNPLVSANGRENNVNQTVNVRGTITDEYATVASARWELVQLINGKETVVQSGEDLKTNLNLTFDTTAPKVQDKSEATLVIYAYDKSGNEGKTTEVYYIDQDTDKPTINPYDEKQWSLDYATEEQLIQYIENLDPDEKIKLNNFTTGSQLITKVTDDDGLKTVVVEITGKDESGKPTAPDSTEYTANNSTDYTLSHTLPKASGYYKVQITATDKNNLKSQEVFYILVSETSTVLTISSTPSYITLNTENISPNAYKSFTINGTNEGTKPFKRVSVSDNENNHAIQFLNAEKTLWKDTFVPSATTEDKEGEVTYTAFNAYGQRASETFKYKLDSQRPVVSISAKPDRNTSESASFRVRGTADDRNGSGVTGVEIKIDGEGNSSTGWITEVSGTTEWS
ncbi:MAG: hypothetical protein MJ188_08145, partial [Treponema sp.]|nr:hypothetical protein [Treponema sp.]